MAATSMACTADGSSSGSGRDGSSSGGQCKKGRNVTESVARGCLVDTYAVILRNTPCGSHLQNEHACVELTPPVNGFSPVVFGPVRHCLHTVICELEVVVNSRLDLRGVQGLLGSCRSRPFLVLLHSRSLQVCLLKSSAAESFCTWAECCYCHVTEFAIIVRNDVFMAGTVRLPRNAGKHSYMDACLKTQRAMRHIVEQSTVP